MCRRSFSPYRKASLSDPRLGNHRPESIDCAWIATGCRFRPLTFTFDNVALCFLLVVVSRALTKQAAKRASNNKKMLVLIMRSS
ncbi:MAG: hypothetical protein AUH19_00260 [Verrucomicrobia bacterium 13_2_20CM_55_10]|nr:MAG: hypothetical protein AUH19_00260 [Verrucomicrobia bacterium 13_2_20CM_55_10]